MSEQPVLQIRQFLPADFDAVRELFASGLLEFAGDVEGSVRRYVDQALKDDMSDIPSHYTSDSRGNFWVAEFGGSVVGIVGIQPTEKQEEAELRRMSVSSSVRRQGIGRRLLETTEEFCLAQGYRRICLSTVDILQNALAMYWRYGYTTVKEELYGDPQSRPITVYHLVKELD